jgi:hypothetical protein
LGELYPAHARTQPDQIHFRPHTCAHASTNPHAVALSPARRCRIGLGGQARPPLMYATHRMNSTVTTDTQDSKGPLLIVSVIWVVATSPACASHAPPHRLFLSSAAVGSSLPPIYSHSRPALSSHTRPPSVSHLSRLAASNHCRSKVVPHSPLLCMLHSSGFKLN